MGAQQQAQAQGHPLHAWHGRPWTPHRFMHCACRGKRQALLQHWQHQQDCMQALLVTCCILSELLMWFNLWAWPHAVADP